MRSWITCLLILFVGASVQAQPVFLKELSANAGNFISSNGKLYYTTGDSLWKSDGTPAGTVLVKKIGESSIQLSGLTLGSSFFFSTTESSGKTALWKSDGSSANTVKIVAYNSIVPLLVHNSELY